MDDSIKKDIKGIIGGSVVLSALMCAVYALIGRYTPGVLFGAILAMIFITINYLYLASAVTKALDMGEAGARYIQRSYGMRMLLHIACGVLAYALPFVDTLAGIIPLLFPRLAIYATQMIRNFGKKGEDDK